MNAITPLTEWISTITKALQALNLNVAYDKSGCIGHCNGRLVVTKDGMLRHHRYEIVVLNESVDGSGSSSPRRFYVQLLNPKVKRTVRLKRFNPDTIASIAGYAAMALASWQSTDQSQVDRAKRKVAAEKVAKSHEIDGNSIPAWAIVSPNIEDDQDADTFRLSFRPYDIGYPLKKLTPAQVKRVISFLKFIDKLGQIPSAMDEISAAVDKAGLYETRPSCTCECLPCQSCDHR